ncbi:unnamed protein product, partial [Mesorhabditis spiculigera]
MVRLFQSGKGKNQPTLAETFATKEGTFELTATLDHVFHPDIVVYHDCNDGKKLGLRRFHFRVPEHYVTAGSKAQKVFDLGKINLEFKPYNEERSNQHRRRRNKEVVSCDQCTIEETVKIDESAEATTRKSKFHGLDESPEARIDPW